jgi:diaminopimelate decarboxylase
MNNSHSISASLPKIISDADTEDTALLITDVRVLKLRLDLLTKAFPSGTRHAVAIKTNPNKQVLATILAQGFDLEAASIEEVELALSAGAEPQQVVFDSPVKTRAEIQQCANYAGMQVNANMLSELQRYPVNLSCKLGLRINPGINTGAPEMFAVSTDESKFGVPLAMEPEILAASLKHPITALHMHSGSQMRDLAVQLQAIRKLFELAETINAHRASHDNSWRIDSINIGGGLPAEQQPEQPSMRSYAAQITELFSEYPAYELRTEFGQWTHQAAGYALTTVEYVGEGPVPNIFVHLGADLFTRHVYAPAAPLLIKVLNPDGVEKTGQCKHYNVAGPLCFAGDYLARNIELPTINEGDWLLIDNVGANTDGLWSRHCSRTIPKVQGIDLQGAVSTWSERQPIGY